MQAPQVRVQLLLYLAIHVNHINVELSSDDSAIFGFEASQFHDGGRREVERPRTLTTPNRRYKWSGYKSGIEVLVLTSSGSICVGGALYSKTNANSHKYARKSSSRSRLQKPLYPEPSPPTYMYTSRRYNHLPRLRC